MRVLAACGRFRVAPRLHLARQTIRERHSVFSARRRQHRLQRGINSHARFIGCSAVIRSSAFGRARCVSWLDHDGHAVGASQMCVFMRFRRVHSLIVVAVITFAGKNSAGEHWSGDYPDFDHNYGFWFAVSSRFSPCLFVVSFVCCSVFTCFRRDSGIILSLLASIG